jgi:predicted nucleotidyltransferase
VQKKLTRPTFLRKKTTRSIASVPEQRENIDSFKYKLLIIKIIMRLTPQEIQVIKSTVKKVMGRQARVWLFGSRVDDNKRGGDIDLFIEADLQNPLDRVQKKSQLWAKLQQRLGEQRIDIILAAAKVEDERRIEQVAKESGVCL